MSAAPPMGTETSARDGLQLLARHGGVVEVRLLETRQATVSGYFDNHDALLKAIAPWENGASIYITLNPVDPDLLARANNRLKGFAKRTTKDDDIERRVWFPTDFDSVRKPGISATDAEVKAALTRRDEAVGFLRELGFSEPVTAMSGNGGHAVFAVDLPNDGVTLALFEGCLKALKARFEDSGVVIVDETVINAARIWKLYGTTARKGDATFDRPHRRAELEHVPAELVNVSLDMLTALAAMAPPPRRTVSAPRGATGPLPPLDLVGAFQARGWYRQALRDGKHAVQCPWSHGHSGDSGVTESCLFEPQGDGEPWGFDCKHSHCADRTIKDVLAVLGLSQNGHHAEPRNEQAPDGPVLVRLDTVDAAAVAWLWPARIPRGKLTLIIGDPGVGKSTVTADVVARTSKGAAWPDGSAGVAASVIWLTAEDGLADTVRPRINRQGGDATRVHVLQAVRVDGVETSFTLERDLPALERALVETQAALCAVDPLSAYLGSRDSYKDAEIRGILAPLVALAERYNVAIVAVLHLTKDAQRRLLHRAQGSIAFVAAARTVFAVGEDPDVPERRLLVGIKSNLGPLPPALAFRIDDHGLGWESDPVTGAADRLLAADLPGTRTERRERDDASTFLRVLLKDGPVASRQVEADAKANGVAQRTLWRAKTELGIVTARGRTLDGKSAWYWTLPAGEAQ